MVSPSSERAPLGLDVDAVRRHFPALSNAGPGGGPLVYLDSPGGTQVPQAVVDAMGSYLIGSNSNIEGEYAASRATDELIAQARRCAGALVGGTMETVTFGQNMTTLNFLISRAFGRTLRAGDQILTTALDHDANVAPWLLLAEDLGLEIREVRATSDLRLDIDDLRRKLTSRTRAVAFTLASNAVGSLTQARLIADLAHEAGALAWVDAVHYAAHRRIDVTELGCDVLLCSPYKFYGPHLGMAWMRGDLAAELPAERVRPAGNTPPGHRFETGTLSHEALAGFVAAVEYLASLGSGSDLGERLSAAYSAIADHERRLTERFLAGLRGLPDWQLAGIDGAAVQDRVATFGLLGPAAPAAMARYLDKLGIYCWNGSFYALNLMRQLGLDEEEGLLRIGFCHYNTTAEVDRLLAALAQMPAL